MDKKEIREKVCEVVDGNYHLSGEIVDDQDFLKGDLGMDSLDVVEMVMKLETMLSVHISDDETSEIERMTVGELVDFLAKKV